MKARIRFEKKGDLCYVGHLDIMRCFQKAIRRAGFDIAYSQGFNPHQILSFASPLSLGMESEGEYFDGEFNSVLPASEMIKRFNEQLPKELKVTSFRILPENVKTNAMATLKACRYRVDFSYGSSFPGDLANLWDSFSSQSNITIEKKTRTSLSYVDIKPLLLSGICNGDSLTLLLRAGSDVSIKPASVLDAFFEYCGLPFSGEDAFRSGSIHITRLDQFTVVGDKYVSLGEIGEINE